MIEIKFYETNKPYGCFSNFAKYPILINDKVWTTTEHYFQAQKFIGTKFEEEVRNATTAMIAAKMGRDKNKPLRKDWEQVKDDVMREAVRAKVEQHKEVRDILISTGNCILIEHTTNDSYWADGGDGSGKNMLGRILMELRMSLDGYTEEFYLPQWIAYPNIHPLDMFWRMGAGETYVMKLAEWFYKLSPESQKAYEGYFIPPKEWKSNF
jgi:ribA/ribD-fused uncharacterized protein